MRFIRFEQPGAADVLTLAEGPKPVPRDGEVLIAVEAAGVNRPDLMQRQGLYPAPEGASPVPGLEVAGRIAALGPGVTGLVPGQRVCALTPGGGYAEFAVAPASHCLPLPESVDAIHGAALAEALFTVWHNVFERGRLAPGETLLVHGGSSGIGSFAIQLGHLLGAKVFATAGSARKCAFCRDLGAVLAINYREQDFVESVLTTTAGRGVDVILDMVGGSYIPRNFRAAALEGRIVSIAVLEGAKAEVNAAMLMMRRLTWTGSTLRAQSVAAKSAIAAALREHVWPLLLDGRLRVPVDRVFSLAQAAAAHQYMEQGQHCGKIVLRVNDIG